MSESAYLRPTKLAKKLVDGQRYLFEVVDGTFREKVVSFNMKEFPKLGGKEYASLSPEDKERIDNAVAPEWPSGDPMPKFEDAYSFALVDVENGIDIFYGIQFKLPRKSPDVPGKPQKDLYSFYRSMTGKDIEEDVLDFNTFFPKGTRFTSTVKNVNGKTYLTRDNKEGYIDIEPTESLNLEPIPELTEDGSKVIAIIQDNIDSWGGKSPNLIYKMLTSKAERNEIGMTVDQLEAAWHNVERRVVDGAGNIRV